VTANNNPIFSAVPKIAWSTAVTAANAAMDGTGTVSTLFTAGANGSYTRRLWAKSVGTNVQTVLRVFINNGSTNVTAANNVLRREITLPATTASNTAAGPEMEIPLEIPLPAGYKINVAIGTAVAAGWVVGVEGGDY
jgi:hypothetical protein